MRPYMDKAMREAWGAARELSSVVSEAALRAGLTPQEAELIKVRASQQNACAFCLDLHSREARKVGVPQQKLDMLPAWRDAQLYSEREEAALAIAEAATRLPLTEDSRADLVAAQTVLGDSAYIAAEWIAVTINTFNRVSILSGHPVQARDADGRLLP
ncbi:carboxymuconolactone decarboxylase family protein [Leifsonia poae]|uniref:carboxymuconolactone decarboxylase family protein n=1 Tax=Leifsonia poae TaxID=110933 RepID=UPI001CBE31EA|nr:carboxymuconolactone decarboxylase family protein [Leifsonia poae]